MVIRQLTINYVMHKVILFHCDSDKLDMQSWQFSLFIRILSSAVYTTFILRFYIEYINIGRGLKSARLV